mmetsp:Transcript_19745/g.39979  ORF Transcript_19745/g.39979 Transcript_19745/m.39979 type:complete len:98 (+) Transcript_19745:71-364(+)
MSDGLSGATGIGIICGIVAGGVIVLGILLIKRRCILEFCVETYERCHEHCLEKEEEETPDVPRNKIEPKEEKKHAGLDSRGTAQKEETESHAIELGA